jgi:hypothetical protein
MAHKCGISLIEGTVSQAMPKKRFVNRVLKGQPARSVIIKFSFDFKVEGLCTAVKMDVSKNSFAQ